jgi:hypothetical protein
MYNTKHLLFRKASYKWKLTNYIMIKKTGLEPNHFFIYNSNGIRISQD